ncbi:hypothetical protein AB1Y20_021343 [Prymnesium parvum]|uniref:Ion transport domain-containing protein n=1 Tax=Prymnesium parvum TaxID=97485 RepID=A0AB34JJB6_PRYPA
MARRHVSGERRAVFSPVLLREVCDSKGTSGLASPENDTAAAPPSSVSPSLKLHGRRANFEPAASTRDTPQPSPANTLSISQAAKLLLLEHGPSRGPSESSGSASPHFNSSIMGEPTKTLRGWLVNYLLELEVSAIGVFANTAVLILIVVSVTCFILQTLPFNLGPDGEPGSCPHGFRHWMLDDAGDVIGCTIEPDVEVPDSIHRLLRGHSASSHGPAYDLGDCRACPMVTSTMWFGVETFCVSAFTAEYVLRAFCADEFLAFVVEPLNLVDLIAIVPFYLELLFASLSLSTQVLRVLRTVRMLKLVRKSKYSYLLRLLVHTFRESAPAFQAALLSLLLTTLVFSSLVWYAERGEWDIETKQWLRSDRMPTPFVSVPATAWWAVVTFTTVGYGDCFPITPLGKLFGFVGMVIGVIVLALPIASISSQFEDLFSALSRANSLEEGSEHVDDVIRLDQRDSSAYTKELEFAYPSASAKSSGTQHARKPFAWKMTQALQQFRDKAAAKMYSVLWLRRTTAMTESVEMMFAREQEIFRQFNLCLHISQAFPDLRRKGMPTVLPDDLADGVSSVDGSHRTATGSPGTSSMHNKVEPNSPSASVSVLNRARGLCKSVLHDGYKHGSLH